jgi:hypothetical protein
MNHPNYDEYHDVQVGEKFLEIWAAHDSRHKIAIFCHQLTLPYTKIPRYGEGQLPKTERKKGLAVTRWHLGSNNNNNYATLTSY